MNIVSTNKDTIGRFGANCVTQSDVMRGCREDEKGGVNCNLKDITIKIPLFYGKNDLNAYLR